MGTRTWARWGTGLSNGDFSLLGPSVACLVEVNVEEGPTRADDDDEEDEEGKKDTSTSSSFFSLLGVLVFFGCLLDSRVFLGLPRFEDAEDDDVDDDDKASWPCSAQSESSAGRLVPALSLNMVPMYGVSLCFCFLCLRFSQQSASGTRGDVKGRGRVGK